MLLKSTINKFQFVQILVHPVSKAILTICRTIHSSDDGDTKALGDSCVCVCAHGESLISEQEPVWVVLAVKLHKKACAHLLIEQPDSTRTYISLPKPRFQTYVMFVLTTTTTFSINNQRAELSTWLFLLYFCRHWHSNLWFQFTHPQHSVRVMSVRHDMQVGNNLQYHAEQRCPHLNNGQPL